MKKEVKGALATKLNDELIAYEFNDNIIVESNKDSVWINFLDIESIEVIVAESEKAQTIYKKRKIEIKLINEKVTEVIHWEDYTEETIQLLKIIQSVIDVHDPTPPSSFPTSVERITELENTILFILGGM